LATSPAAKIRGSLLRNVWSTTTPLSSARSAVSARSTLWVYADTHDDRVGDQPGTVLEQHRRNPPDGRLLGRAC